MSGCESFQISTTFLMFGAQLQNVSVTGSLELALLSGAVDALSSEEPPPLHPATSASESSSSAARRAVVLIRFSSPMSRSVTAHRLGTGGQGCQVAKGRPDVYCDR